MAGETATAQALAPTPDRLDEVEIEVGDQAPTP
jgi:hypothetical protein